MPVIFGPSIVEGKVYRGKKKTEEDEEKRAMLEIQSMLNARGRKSCECEAQIHNLLENCLNCGRLTCELEGPGKCFSCGSLVMSQEQKERLKKYIDISQTFSLGERSDQSASKIRIIDNQFDHSAVENTRHLSAQEKQKLKDNLAELQSNRYKRQLVLDIDIDNMQAGTSAVPIIDYNAEMRKLQISEPSTSNHPTVVESFNQRSIKSPDPVKSNSNKKVIPNKSNKSGKK